MVFLNSMCLLSYLKIKVDVFIIDTNCTKKQLMPTGKNIYIMQSKTTSIGIEYTLNKMLLQ